MVRIGLSEEAARAEELRQKRRRGEPDRAVMPAPEMETLERNRFQHNDREDHLLIQFSQ